MENSQPPLMALSIAPPPAVMTSVYHSTHHTARPRKGAPVMLTGCVSNLSSCPPPDHAYFDALKNYAEIYAATQEYLGLDDPVAEHDYTLDVAETEEHSRLGLLGDETTPKPDEFSDDEIAGCGYLGWLHH
jgi:hypothetical protein